MTRLESSKSQLFDERNTKKLKRDVTFKQPKNKIDKVDDLVDFDRDRNSALERSTDDDVIELAERILMETDRPLIQTPDIR